VFAQQACVCLLGRRPRRTFSDTERMFTRVVVLDAQPAGQALPDGLNGVVELSDMTYEFDQPESLRYEVELYRRRASGSMAGRSRRPCRFGILRQAACRR